MKALVLSVFTVLAVLVGLLAALVFYTFAPFQIAGVTPVENQVCPLANVSVTADLSIEDGWDLKKLTIESTWEPVGDNQALPVSGGIATVPEPGPELGKLSESPVLRVAPEAPGTYRLRSEATLIGTFSKQSPAHGWPKVQIIEYKATDTVTVLSPEAPECKENP